MATASIGTRLRHIIGDAFGAEIVEQNLEKAMKDMRDRASAPEPQSQFYDSVSMFMGTEWMQRKAEGLSMRDLRQMAKNPIIGSIIQTRKNQVASFCYPQKNEYDYGYIIKGVSDDDNKQTEAKQLVSDWVYHCGLIGYGEDLLETWARKFIEDSLVLDQGTTEIVNLRNKMPGYLVSNDAATIKRLEASLYYAEPKDEPLYVQVLDEQIKAQFTADQLIFGIRNPKTDITYCGYGMSELETLLRTVTTIINTERYNSGQLTQGGIQKGILVVKGDAAKDQVESFKRDFRETIRNAAAYWRPPVLHVSKDADVDWVTLDRSQRDMEYAQLFEFLVKQACGVYQIDPTEINWSISGANTTINYEGRQDDKVRNSQHRGLNPLLVFIANQLNSKVINRLDPRFRIEFAGLDRDKEADMKLLKDEVSTFKTVNEIRTARGLKSLGAPGDIILSDVFIKARDGDGSSGEVTIDDED